MVEPVVQRPWTPLPRSLPADPLADTLYLVPTRAPMRDDDNSVPLYTDTVRFVPKEARADGVPLQFAVSTDSRRFLSEFSADASTWTLALAFVGPLNAWVIYSVQSFLAHRAARLGFEKDEGLNRPLRLSIAEMDITAGLISGLEIEGTGAEVIETLKTLRALGPAE
jgi:hypothetical protein